MEAPRLRVRVGADDLAAVSRRRRRRDRSAGHGERVPQHVLLDVAANKATRHCHPDLYAHHPVPGTADGTVPRPEAESAVGRRARVDVVAVPPAPEQVEHDAGPDGKFLCFGTVDTSNPRSVVTLAIVAGRWALAISKLGSEMAERQALQTPRQRAMERAGSRTRIATNTSVWRSPRACMVTVGR